MKETLILLHGALGSENQFAALKELLEESFIVHTFNFEGHGGNPSDNEFSIQLFSQNLMDFIAANSIEECTIFGYSMGGYVALYTALKIPQKIKKIITLGTKFKWDMESTSKEIKMLNPHKIEENIPRYAEKLKQEHTPQDWKEVMNKTAEMMLNMAQGDRLFDADFKQIKQPVIIGIGSLDTMVTLEESDHISRILPNSKLVQLEGVKHPIDKIEPIELTKFILSN